MNKWQIYKVTDRFGQLKAIRDYGLALQRLVMQLWDAIIRFCQLASIITLLKITCKKWPRWWLYLVNGSLVLNAIGKAEIDFPSASRLISSGICVIISGHADHYLTSESGEQNCGFSFPPSLWTAVYREITLLTSPSYPGWNDSSSLQESLARYQGSAVCSLKV